MRGETLSAISLAIALIQGGVEYYFSDPLEYDFKEPLQYQFEAVPQPVQTTKEDKKEEDKKPKERKARILLFTADWCAPCQQFKKDFLDKLPPEWTVGSENHNHIQVIDCTKGKPPIAEEYEVDKYPMLVFIGSHLRYTEGKYNGVRRVFKMHDLRFFTLKHLKKYWKLYLDPTHI